MKGIEKAIINAAVLADSGGVTTNAFSNGNLTKVDFGTYPLLREFVLSAHVVPNTTSPGSTAWIALNWYWSDYEVATPSTNVPIVCVYRKFTTGPIPLPALTLAGGGTRDFAAIPARSLRVLTSTASTTTATLTFPPNIMQDLVVGEWVTVSGGSYAGDGNQIRGTYQLAAVTQTSGANGQLVNTATYTIASTTGTLVGAVAQVQNSIRSGGNDLANLAIMRPQARYLYVSVDRSAVASDATTTLSVNLVRIPSQSMGINNIT